MSSDPPGTFDLEDGLPRLPVPSLAESRDRFLDWCAPLIDDDELAATRAAVDELLDPAGPGPVLQAALEEYAAAAPSWLDAFWEARYLGRRDRIALNANFFFLFARPEHAARDRDRRAAELVVAALAHHRAVTAGTLAPDRGRGEAHTMQQHRYLFSATRIPGEVRDTARTPYTPEHPGPSTARHIVVLRRGRMWRVDVLGPDGVPHGVEEIAAALRSLDDVAPAAPGSPVGHLTTKARAAWAADRHRLLAVDPGNGAALETVESALCCLALEDAVPADDTEAGRALLAGDSANRWFDKALTLVVFGDATAGINVEHARLDGTTVLMLVDGMLGADAATHARRAGARSGGEPAVTEVEFALDEDLRSLVSAAGEDFAAYAAAVATEVVVLDGAGSEHAKGLGLSPDAFVQCAYQLAQARVRGFLGATYESIATRGFHHGRTEAMRVVTPQMVALVAALDDPDADDRRRRAALEDAVAAHTERARACRAGHAPEQHLWELALLAQRRGAELGVPEQLAVTGSPGWTRMRDDHLSTSSAPSPHVRCFGFGATGQHCIGVAYVLLPDRLTVHLSTPAAAAGTMHAFARELRRAVAELGEVARRPDGR